MPQQNEDIINQYARQMVYALYEKAHHQAQYILFKADLVKTYYHQLVPLLGNGNQLSERLFENLVHVVENALKELDVIVHGQQLPLPQSVLGSWYSLSLGWANKEPWSVGKTMQKPHYKLSLTSEGEKVYQAYLQVVPQNERAKNQ